MYWYTGETCDRTKILKIIYIFNNMRTLKLGWCNERDKYPVESESARLPVLQH